MAERELCLFDVDGTLTLPRKNITPEMKSFLAHLHKKASIGIIGGSDFVKIAEQMGDGEKVINTYDYVFAENGLIAYKDGKLVGKQSILEYMGEAKLQRFINFCLKYMSSLNLPAKRGNFIEFRTGLLNVSPIGRGCSQEERDHFEQYDKIHKIREQFVQAIKENLPDIGLTYAIGGQISFDCFPVGWDKTYCLKLLMQEGFSKIHFFGDKTYEGGNDHEIYNHPDVIGHKVTSPDNTKELLEEIFGL